MEKLLKKIALSDTGTYSDNWCTDGVCLYCKQLPLSENSKPWTRRKSTLEAMIISAKSAEKLINYYNFNDCIEIDITDKIQYLKSFKTSSFSNGHIRPYLYFKKENTQSFYHVKGTTASNKCCNEEGIIQCNNALEQITIHDVKCEYPTAIAIKYIQELKPIKILIPKTEENTPVLFIMSDGAKAIIQCFNKEELN